MPGLELPDNLRRAVEAGRSTDAQGLRRWVLDLPRLVEHLAERWSLVLGRPFQPGGVASWVAPARTADGRHLALEVGWRHDESLHEAEGLAVWGGRGAVRLVDVEVGDRTCALLLELCEPGAALARLLPPEEQDAVIAGLLHRLWVSPPADSPFRPLQSMRRWWADAFDQRIALLEPQRLHVDPGLLRAGSDLFRHLPGTAEREVLLCTDLHADDVLAARREPWLVIDPEPYRGDPTYDVLQHAHNCPDRLVADPGALADRLAGPCDLDAGRLRRWLFARCVLDVDRSPHLRGVVRALAP